MENFIHMPIVRPLLPQTGRLDGDDRGFRLVAISPLDKIEPDPLVILNERIKCYPRLQNEPRNNFEPKICKGDVKEGVFLLREPAVRALEELNQVLEFYGREVVITAAFRHMKNQAKVFSDVLYRWLGEQEYNSLSVQEQIQLGRKANEAALYADVIKDDIYFSHIKKLQESDRLSQIIEAATFLKISVESVMEEISIYEANLGFNNLNFDKVASTAHGNGGSVDAWVINSSTGKFVNRGVPSAYNFSPTVMDYFEWATPEMFEEERKKSPSLDGYLSGYGIDTITENVMKEIRNERRILFHAMKSVGATYFSLGKTEGECWHFNFGNERGGKQFEILPYGGGAPHSLLKNVRDKKTGQITACWTNEVAHQMAEDFMK